MTKSNYLILQYNTVWLRCDDGRRIFSFTGAHCLTGRIILCDCFFIQRAHTAANSTAARAAHRRREIIKAAQSAALNWINLVEGKYSVSLLYVYYRQRSTHHQREVPVCGGGRLIKKTTNLAWPVSTSFSHQVRAGFFSIKSSIKITPLLPKFIKRTTRCRKSITPRRWLLWKISNHAGMWIFLLSETLNHLYWDR